MSHFLLMESKGPEQLVNGDEIRNVRFGRGDGYDASQVDDLLTRIAAEVDAGRPAGPLISNAAFRREWGRRGYHAGSVDWYLDQLWRKVVTGEEPARLNADPWRDLDADNYSISNKPGRSSGSIVPPSRQECDTAWLDWDLEPGTRLLWVGTGSRRHELCTADQQTVASVRSSAFGGQGHFSAGGKTFTSKPVPRSARPGIAGTISRDRPAGPRRLLPGGPANNEELRALSGQLLNETGTPILYAGGVTVARDEGYIKFPGREYLRFPVRGTSRGNAIMTAVDQAGNKVARYRLIWNKRRSRDMGDITLHPGLQLTDELALTILLSAPWLDERFQPEPQLAAAPLRLGTRGQGRGWPLNCDVLPLNIKGASRFLRKWPPATLDIKRGACGTAGPASAAGFALVARPPHAGPPTEGRFTGKRAGGHTSAHDTHRPGPAARPASEASLMTGDEVRATWFLRGGGAHTGYGAAKVDDLLRRIAVELDAGRPIEPLIENAAFRERYRKRNTYDRDAVDWFLDQLLLRAGDGESAETGDDPWRDLPVAQLTRSGGGGPAHGRPKYRVQRQYFAEECQNAWRDFGQQPGIYLRWERAGSGRWLVDRYELRTNEQQTIASVETPVMGVGSGAQFPFARARVGERRFDVTGGTRAIAEIGGRSKWARFYPYKKWGAHTFQDEAGTPILYAGGVNWTRSAGASVIFPDRRWLRFPVRGTRQWNAIMTAVDQAGNRVARYRRLTEGWETVEIAVHPDRNLTDELVLAIAISAYWCDCYFREN